MSNCKSLVNMNSVEESRKEKLDRIQRYQSMIKSNPDKTNFKRPPYYLTVGTKQEKKK